MSSQNQCAMAVIEPSSTQWETQFQSHCCLMWTWCERDGPAPSLPVPAGRGELSAYEDSRRNKAGGQCSEGGCQPHFTKPLLVLRCFFLHHNKPFWNMNKKENFPPCLSSLWFRYRQGARRSRFNFLSPTQVFPSPVTSLTCNGKVS